MYIASQCPSVGGDRCEGARKGRVWYVFYMRLSAKYGAHNNITTCSTVGAPHSLIFVVALLQLRQGSEWHTSLSLGERSVGWRESHHDYHVMRFRDTNTDSRQTKVPAATEREEGHARRWFDLPQYNVDLPQYNVDKMQADRCRPGTPS